MAYVDWVMKGPAVTNCNCDWGCPCQFNALPTHGDCRAMSAQRVDEGHFGDVDLAGTIWCGMFAWPEAIHLGNGEAFVAIDEGASEQQRSALLAILTGEETEPGATIFNVFAATFTTLHAPLFAPISFACDLDKCEASVGIENILDTAAEPIRNPVTNEPHHVKVSLPHGFEYHEAEYVSGTTRATGAVDLDFGSSHGHMHIMHIGTNGPIG